MKMRKLALLCCGFAVAVFLKVYAVSANVLLPLGAVCLILFLVTMLLQRKVRWCRAMCWAAAGLAAAFFWCGAYDHFVSEPALELAGQTVEMEAEVTAWPRKTDYGISVEAKLLRDDGISIGTIVYLDEAYSTLKPGDRLNSVAKLTDAGVVAGEFSDTYYSRGIRLKAVCYGKIEVESASGMPWRYFPLYLSRAVKNGIAAAFPKDVAPVVLALVTGDKDGLSDDFYNAMKRAGLAHTVAVSGMHLTFLAGMLQVLFRRKRSTALISIAVIVLFTLMVGATPSVVRAAVMQILLLLAPLLDREYDSVTSISLSLALILLFNPYAAASAGLQLSFSAVVGIGLVGAPAAKWLTERGKLKSRGGNLVKRGWNWLLRAAVSSVALSLGAMLFTVPVTVLQFGTATLISPLSNLLAFLPVSVAFAFGLLGGLAALAVPALGMVVGLPATLCVRYLNEITYVLSDRLPYATVTITGFYMAAWLLLAYALLLLNLLWRGKGKRRPVLSAMVAAVSFCLVIGLNSATFTAGDLTVSVLDVGQGQSVLLRSGTCWTLVDCGGNEQESAGDIAADYLESLGQRSLDFLILTHYHEDHANGIGRLLERVSVDTILLPDVERDDELRQEILRLAEQEQTEVRFVTSDTNIQVGQDKSITVYAPLGEGTSTNELGLSILATAGDFDTLITGDMDENVEKLLLRHAALPDIELLVVGHHGSRYSTSEELLTAVRPEWAVISVGHNSYGHPTQDVLDRLDEVGAEVYRTDKQGTVTLSAGEAA